MEEFDYVIVGAGSAGSVLAARLSEDPGCSVLLLEAGPPDTHPFVHIPAAYPRLFASSRDWADLTQPQEALAGRTIFWPRGRMVGGSSSLNAMLWVPGIAADYEQWARRAGPLWNASEVTRCLHAITLGDARGAGSRPGIAVSAIAEPNPLTRAFVAAARAMGMADLDLQSGDDGVGLFPVTQRRGRRFSAADGYLRPARGRRNLVLRTRAQATRVVFSDSRASGVTYRQGRSEHAVGARREVVLAAGAVASPQLLQCSGVGPGELLRRLGIPVVADRPAVGSGLKDHLTSGIVMRTRRPLSLINATRLPALARYLARRRGPLASPIAEGVAFLRSSDELALPDLELVFAPVAFLDEGRSIPKVHGVTLAAVLLQPESSGTVRITSRDVATPPAIDPCYLSDPAGHDRSVLTAGIERCLRVCRTEPLAGELAEPILPAGATEDDLVERCLEENSQTLYHPAATCAMGTDEHSVLDPRCRVRGVAGLRVVDASAMPSLNRGHTNAPTLALAERAAELIRER